MNIRRGFYFLVLLTSITLLALFMQYRATRDYSRVRKPPITVTLGGDFFAGPRLKQYVGEGSSRRFARSVSSKVSGADLSILNLEAPLTARGDTILEKDYHLRNAPSIALPILDALSIDGVSLANNHVLDYGQKGLLRTVRLLNSREIKHAGAGGSLTHAVRPVFFKRRGRTIAFLAFSNTFPKEFWANVGKPGTAYGQPDVVRAMTSFASSRADRVIVSFHWGGEGDLRPKQYQVQLAHLAVNAGADVVFGHHPHTVQPMERYRGSVILYSLGNFLFTTLSHRVNYGLIADVTFEVNEPPDVGFHVLNVNNYDVHYRPKIVRTLVDPLKLSMFIRRPDFVRIAGDRDRSWVNPVHSLTDVH